MAVDDETEATPRPATQVLPARQLRRHETLFTRGNEDVTESTPSGDDSDYEQGTEGSSIGGRDTDKDTDVEEQLCSKKKAKKIST
jgi:hypothetical protein